MREKNGSREGPDSWSDHFAAQQEIAEEGTEVYENRDPPSGNGAETECLQRWVGLLCAKSPRDLRQRSRCHQPPRPHKHHSINIACGHRPGSGCGRVGTHVFVLRLTHPETEYEQTYEDEHIS